MKTSQRSAFVFLFDLAAVVSAWIGAFVLRFNFEWPIDYEGVIATGLVVLLPAHAAICRWAGLYRGLWIFASLPDLKRVLRAVAVSSLMLLALAALYRGTPVVPRSIVVLYPILLAVWMTGGRVAYRMFKEHRLYGGLSAEGKPVVIVGAGRGGAMLVRELDRVPDWRVVGLVDDDPAKWGREVLGRPVFGAIESLPQVLANEKARHTILAIPSASTEVRRRATDLAIQAGAHVFTVPGVEDLLSGRVAVTSIRPVEIDDLLGREPVEIDTANVSGMLAGRTVLVTGAGGSIGAELCRQMARFAPARLVLFEQSEFALYTIEQEFSAIAPTCTSRALARRRQGRRAARRGLRRAPPAGRVPRRRLQARAADGGRQRLAGGAQQRARHAGAWPSCARRHGAAKFVLISTDKAVNPTNVMGATKRLAEMVCQALQAAGGARSS